MLKKRVAKGTVGMNVHFVTRPIQIFKMLEAGRVEIVVVDRLTGDEVLANNSFPDILRLSPPTQFSFIPLFKQKK